MQRKRVVETGQSLACQNGFSQDDCNIAGATSKGSKSTDQNCWKPD